MGIRREEEGESSSVVRHQDVTASCRISQLRPRQWTGSGGRGASPRSESAEDSGTIINDSVAGLEVGLAFGMLDKKGMASQGTWKHTSEFPLRGSIEWVLLTAAHRERHSRKPAVVLVIILALTCAAAVVEWGTRTSSSVAPMATIQAETNR